MLLSASSTFIPMKRFLGRTPQARHETDICRGKENKIVSRENVSDDQKPVGCSGI